MATLSTTAVLPELSHRLGVDALWEERPTRVVEFPREGSVVNQRLYVYVPSLSVPLGVRPPPADLDTLGAALDEP